MSKHICICACMFECCAITTVMFNKCFASSLNFAVICSAIPCNMSSYVRKLRNKSVQNTKNLGNCGVGRCSRAGEGCIPWMLSCKQNYLACQTVTRFAKVSSTKNSIPIYSERGAATAISPVPTPVKKVTYINHLCNATTPKSAKYEEPDMCNTIKL